RKTRAKSVDVIMRARRRHVFHAAAGRDERILKNRKLACPADRFIERRRHEIKFFDLRLRRYFSHSRAPFFQAYINPKTSMKTNENISMIPVQRSDLRITAQGKNQTISTSKRIKSIATR